nr:hypothetical protein [Azospirillum sp. TSA2s]
MLPSSTQLRKSAASFDSSASGALAMSVRALRTRSRIGVQSSTAARTSASTRSIPSRRRAWAAGSDSGSIEQCMKDSSRAPSFSSPGSRSSTMRPSASRTTRVTGWMMRWTVTPCRFSSAVTESTRKGMSSLTISTTERSVCQPCSSSRGA